MTDKQDERGMKLLRVENPDTMQGLWYRGDSTFNPIITTLGGAKCANLPMEFDPAFKVDGLDWFSACDSANDMSNWFSVDDLRKLSARGYRLFEFQVERYRTVNGHAAFARQHVITALPVPMTVICAEWGSDQ
jgi:hypothetical protein